MNNAELEDLYRETFPRVYSYAYYRVLDPALAEDLTSAVFVKAVDALDRFDPSKASFATWVLRIAHNVVVDHYRTRKECLPLEALGAQEPACEDEYPALSERVREVARLLACLSEADRELVFLKYHEGKRNVEIARDLGMNPATVGTRLHRALAAMRAAGWAAGA